MTGIAALKRHRFTYDVLVFPRHLEAVHVLLKKNQNQPFVVDHLAKPYIKKGLIKQWAKDLRRLARYPNVYCKLSGMDTQELTGMTYNPLTKIYKLGADTDVNYLMSTRRGD